MCADLLNLLSLAGFMGGVAQEKALELLARGWYMAVESDLHNRGMLEKAMGVKLKKKVLERLERVKS